MMKKYFISIIIIIFLSTSAIAKEASCVEDPIETEKYETWKMERIPVAIYLVNGIKLQGQIEDFSCKTILLKNTVSQIVYKHAISTVVPARQI